ncbi:hypothetical protein IKE72_02075 [Candidatus Saccharibacteria bacterium]|nr:hypothetical protein [Candidatus Saccharibacteria bacterium]
MSERLHTSDEGYEKPDWKIERENDLSRKMKMGGAVLAVTASVILGAAMSNRAKTNEIMSSEERAKNVKRIEAEAVVFHDAVNARQEPYVDNTEPNQLATVENEEGSVTVDYNGDAYYYHNEEDPNGGWYGFEAAQLSNELLEDSYITKSEAEDIRSDETTGDGVVWFNEKYVSVVPAEDAIESTFNA